MRKVVPAARKGSTTLAVSSRVVPQISLKRSMRNGRRTPRLSAPFSVRAWKILRAQSRWSSLASEV